MVADNCRLSCQLDALVLLTNRSAKLIRKCCKSGNYGYHFSLGAVAEKKRKKTKTLKRKFRPTNEFLQKAPEFELKNEV